MQEESIYIPYHSPPPFFIYIRDNIETTTIYTYPLSTPPQKKKYIMLEIGYKIKIHHLKDDSKSQEEQYATWSGMKIPWMMTVRAFPMPFSNFPFCYEIGTFT